MLIMILKMSVATLLYVFLTVIIWLYTKNRKLTPLDKLIIGIIFGISSILSTHFGVSYENMVMNVRDLGPLAAGLFFSPSSGIVAGLIGGIERYIAGTYFDVGSYTRIACSISTCLAGFVAMAMNMFVFKGKKPSPPYALFMGAVMEVFHMYVVFITHRDDMRMAFLVVSTCSVHMIIFSGLGLSISSVLLQYMTGEWRNPFRKSEDEEVSVSQKFQKWLFLVTSLVIITNFAFSYIIQTQTAYQDGRSILQRSAQHIRARYYEKNKDISPESDVIYYVVNETGRIVNGDHEGTVIDEELMDNVKNRVGETFFDSYFDVRYLVHIEKIDNKNFLVVAMTESDLYWYRDAEAYEIGLADVLLFTVIYVLIAFLVNQIVVNNIQLINDSLGRITNGDLTEVVTVRSSSEFASLSDDINQTVLTLKGYIEAAEKRIEQELILAKTIQESALPTTFEFPGRNEFEIFASMKPAKEVGGDFYDFFFVDSDKFALVIADVSGKGIPAALFMMRAKTAIRSLAESGLTPGEILAKANNSLCEGNDADMFVTVWLGIIDLKTGVMTCANAGHEYPAIKRRGGDYELLKDKHSLALAVMENMKPKEYEVTLELGDKLFVYTDGVPEAIDDNTVQYGTDRMLEVLNSVEEKEPADILQAVSQSLEKFKGNADQFDDITMIGFEFMNRYEASV